MHTPIKPKVKILNSSFSPFTSLASSKISTNCDLQRNQSNSISKKRFARRRQSSNESLRRFKTSQTEQKVSKRQQRQEAQNVEESPVKEVKEGIMLTKLNFRKDSLLTSKYVKMPTQRSQTYQQYPKHHDYTYNGPNTSRTNYRNKTQVSQFDNEMMDYKMQLQIKNSEFMILEDDNARMKKQLKTKEVMIQKLQRQKQKLNSDMQEMKRLQSIKIVNLQNQLKQKDNQIALKQQMIEKNEKKLIEANSNIKTQQKQIDILKIHLQQIITKKVSKQNLQLISYRELSLQNQLNLLKQQFETLKTQQHRNLQSQLNKIKQKLSLVSKDCQNLSIANRVLNKKNQQLDVSIQKKYKNQLTQIKEKVKTLIKQTSTLKKQNVTLKKTIHLQQKKIEPSLLKQMKIQRPNRLLTGSNKKSQQNYKDLESDDSFTISLSK